jgi:hypothetical protein
VWGATCRWKSNRCACCNFNSRSRVGSDIPCNDTLLNRCISIHAPVWGATWLLRYRLPLTEYFNSRSRVGSDACYIVVRILMQMISIHAPVWGATSRRFRLLPAGRRNFNSRSRVGSDDSLRVRVIYQIKFQFTLPCGERPAPVHPCPCCI